MHASDSDSFATNFKAARLKAGLSQPALARRLGVTDSVVTRYESGKNKPRPGHLTGAIAIFNSECAPMQPLTSDHFYLSPELFNALIGANQVDPFARAVRQFGPEYREQVLAYARTATKFVHCSYLCKLISDRPTRGPIELTDPEFCEAIKTERLEYQRIQLFFNEEDLIEAVVDQLRLGRRHYLHYFAAPPNSIPAMNIRSFDDKYFMLGGFYQARSARPDEKIVIVNNVQPWMDFLKEYWAVLWTHSKEFPRAPNFETDEHFLTAVKAITRKSWPTIRREGLSRFKQLPGSSARRRG